MSQFPLDCNRMLAILDLNESRLSTCSSQLSLVLSILCLQMFSYTLLSHYAPQCNAQNQPQNLSESFILLSSDFHGTHTSLTNVRTGPESTTCVPTCIFWMDSLRKKMLLQWLSFWFEIIITLFTHTFHNATVMASVLESKM
jgi:hypothetical protein